MDSTKAVRWSPIETFMGVLGAEGDSRFRGNDGVAGMTDLGEVLS